MSPFRSSCFLWGSQLLQNHHCGQVSHKNHLGDVSGLHSVGEAARHGDAGGEQGGGRGLGRRDGRGDGQEGGQRGGLGLGLGVVSGCAEVALPLQGKLQSLPLVSLSDLSTATQAQQANTHKRAIEQKAGHFYDNLSRIKLEVYSKGKLELFNCNYHTTRSY